MSGSNSSARAVKPDPLSFTVHNVATPDLQADQRRTRVGRFKMLMVLLVCAAPVIASYLTYFVIRPQARSNYSALILPTRGLPALALTTLDGKPVAAASLKGQWLLLAVGPSACAGACEQRLYMQRQLREMLGREKARIDKVWFVIDTGAVAPRVQQAVMPMTVLRVDGSALAAWLLPEPGRALEDHLYVVDPMGEWMMRVPADPDPARVKRDLERLLRASASWDLPGR